MRKFFSTYIFLNRIALNAILMIICLVLASRPINEDVVLLGMRRTSYFEVNYVELVRWLLLFCVPIVVNGCYLDRVEKLRIFLCTRLNEADIYGIILLAVPLFNTFIWELIIFVYILVFLDPQLAWSQLLLGLSNLNMWTALQICLHIVTGFNALLGPLLICLVAGTYILSCNIPTLEMFLPSTWGMVYKSDLYCERGYSHISLFLMSCFAFLILIMIIIKSGRAIKRKA